MVLLEFVMKFPIKRGRPGVLCFRRHCRAASSLTVLTIPWTGRKINGCQGNLKKRNIFVTDDAILLHLIYKRFAVRTFLLGRIHLVGTDLNRIKSTVIGGICMIRTILDGTLDTFVRSVYFHGSSSFMNGCL